MPMRVDVKIQLANMLKDTRRFSEAETAYLEALEADPLYADTHLQLGHLRKLTGRRGLALASYQRALELDPLSAAARRELVAAGETAAQLAAFELQMRGGGTDALLTIRSRLDEIARQIDEMRRNLPAAQASAAFPVDAYAELRRVFDIPPPAGAQTNLSIAIVLLADREPLERLHVQLSAIRDQAYGRWVLRVLGTDADRREAVDRASASDSRIAWAERQADESVVAFEDRIARAAGAEWVLLLSHGAVLHRQGLSWIAETAARTGCDAIVMDEEVGETGEFFSDLRPILRQAVDRDTLLEANIYGESVALASSVLRTIEPARELITVSSARSHLLLNLIGKHRVAHLPLPLVRTPSALDPDPGLTLGDHAAAVRAVLGDKAAMSIGPAPWSQDTLRVFQTPGERDRRIDVVIPTKNNSYDAAECVKSLISNAKRPGSLRILVLNNGPPTEADPILQSLAQTSNVTIRELPGPFNWSRFSNFGAAQTTAPYLIFANDDMLMLTRGWDEIVRSLMERPEVGAAGARLLYPDETLQHAGVLFDWQESVIHDGLYRLSTEGGPTLRWHTTRSASAVTGAFLITRRSEFEAVAGFDETHLAVAYSDIDYALKLRARGLRIIWTPMLTLYHYESKTRGLDHLHPAKAARNDAERRVMETRWRNALSHEPSLNPFWRQATLPHRLLSFPSEQRIWAHIQSSASLNPWIVEEPRIDA